MRCGSTTDPRYIEARKSNMSEETSSELTVGRKALAVVVVVARLSLTVARCVKCPLHDGKGHFTSCKGHLKGLRKVEEKDKDRTPFPTVFFYFFGRFMHMP